MSTAENGSSGALTTREEFGATEMIVQRETAAIAAAAQAEAMVKGRFVMALQRPRDWDAVRVSILKDCKRTSFAEVARYRKPIGEGVEGFSIRFAEAALRHMTNLLVETPTLYDDDEKRIVRASVTDLEGNATYTKDVTIAKTVERNFLKKDQVPLKKRVNSKGKTVYIVEASEDDLLAKENALLSKAIRNGVLRLLPGDIQDEAWAQITETLKLEVERDPDAARKKIVDAFAEQGVKPADLKTYLGHDIAAASPAQLDELRKVHAAVKTGEASWADILAAKTGKADDGEAKDANAALKDKLGKKPKPAAESEPCDACGSKDGNHAPACPEAPST